MSKRFKKLTHSLYECKYNIVFCPKYRYRVLSGELAGYAREQVLGLLGQKEAVEVLELNVQPDHVHLVASIPPKYAVSAVMGLLKGKLALKLFARYEKLGRRFWGRHYGRAGTASARSGSTRNKSASTCAGRRNKSAKSNRARRNCSSSDTGRHLPGAITAGHRLWRW